MCPVLLQPRNIQWAPRSRKRLAAEQDLTAGEIAERGKPRLAAHEDRHRSAAADHVVLRDGRCAHGEDDVGARRKLRLRRALLAVVVAEDEIEGADGEYDGGAAKP